MTKNGEIIKWNNNPVYEISQKKRENFNSKIVNRFRKIQLSLDYKRKKSNFIIKNNFTNKTIKNQVRYILKQIH